MKHNGREGCKQAFDTIRSQQSAWAGQRRIEVDKDGYTRRLGDNLFIPLSTDSEKEFVDGKGNEFGRDGKRGKMHALHSSSALVCNVFEHWRNRDPNTIAQACGAPAGMSEMHFERRHHTCLRGTPPHLDVEFMGKDLKPFAIESKFTEPYQHTPVARFAESYFATPGLWDDLPQCEKLARDIRNERIVFRRLDAPQLLKHVLGLTTAHGPSRFQLLYLWYEVALPEAIEHRQEVEIFRKCVQDEIQFRDMTYQKLFDMIRKSSGAKEAYISYLATRYFS